MGYTQVAAGVYHTVLLRSDGTVVACGYNGFGQCSIPALDGDVTYTEAIWKPRILLQGAFQKSADTTVMRLYFLSGEEYCQVNILPTDIVSEVLARLRRDLGNHCLPEVILPNGDLLACPHKTGTLQRSAPARWLATILG